MYKWVTITGIVCLGFIVVLLSLGYLLKENEVAVNVLKDKLEQQKVRTANDNSPTARLTFVDTEQVEPDKLSRFKTIIVKNITCTDAKQCVLINTKEPELNCIVSVNTIGASLLMKELKEEHKGKTGNKNKCNLPQKHLTNICEQNMCQVEARVLVQ
jgi:hypothetical protein